MGAGHSTYVSNGYGKDVLVVGSHSNGRSDQTILKHGEVKGVMTDLGTVTISIYDPEHFDLMEPLARRTIPSNVSVTIAKDFLSKPKIVRVLFGSFWDEDPDNN
ncbi:hypothetical protein FKM82_029159 [Ascaphus truei]